MNLKQSIYGALLATALISGPAFAEMPVIQKQTVNEALRARLPEDIRKAGFMTSVNSGSFPPYDIIISATETSGASADFNKALGELLGIEVRHVSVSGLPSLLGGVDSGRYQFAFGPIGDFPAREEKNDFVDYVQEFVIFAVQKGNPEGIVSLDTTCGKRIAVQGGGSAERVIKAQSEKCATSGKQVEIMAFNDQPTAILAVRSKRADAFFSSQAPLTYFVQQSEGQLELAGIGQKNGFDDLYQGAVVAKGSPLGPVLLDGIKILIDNGTYAAIMKKWGLENNMLKQPGINLAGQKAK